MDLPFMFFTTLVVKKSPILSRIYRPYLSEKSILVRTGEILNSKFANQWKNWKGSYEERQMSAFVCELVALILVQKFLKF